MTCVRKMAVAAHHALLDAPGIGADLQHVEIVIRFEQQDLHAAQMEFDGIGHVAEIGRDADLNAFGVEAEADRIDRRRAGCVKLCTTMLPIVQPEPA